MGAKTKISWTDASWNALRGCSRVSAGCQNCYAETLALRFSGPGEPYEGLVRQVNGHAQWTGVVRFIPEHLHDPIRWKLPKRIFVNSMSDVFHPAVEDKTLILLFAVMLLAQQHTFQILTKRPQRMATFLRRRDLGLEVALEARTQAMQLGWKVDRWPAPLQRPEGCAWPLPNVWLGTSCENQETADERLDALMSAPGALHFASFEPLLGPITLPHGIFQPNLYGARLDWAIVGGESGAGFRPMDLRWASDLQGQCGHHRVPFWFKQVASFRSGTGEAALGRVIQQFPESRVIPLPPVDTGLAP